MLSPNYPFRSILFKLKNIYSSRNTLLILLKLFYINKSVNKSSNKWKSQTYNKHQIIHLPSLSPSSSKLFSYKLIGRELKCSRKDRPCNCRSKSCTKSFRPALHINVSCYLWNWRDPTTHRALYSRLYYILWQAKEPASTSGQWSSKEATLAMTHSTLFKQSLKEFIQRELRSNARDVSK